MSGIVQLRLSEIGARINERMQEVSSHTGIDFSSMFAQTVVESEEVSDPEEVAAEVSEVPEESEIVDEIQESIQPASEPKVMWSVGREVYLELIEKIAAQYGADPDLIAAVIQAESSFDPYAVSSSGASGLMQLMPATAAGLGVGDVFDPEQNIDGGVRFLLGQIIRYDGDVLMALASYNCGANGLSRRGITSLSDPEQWELLPQDTQTYLNNIIEILDAAGRRDLFDTNYFE